MQKPNFILLAASVALTLGAAASACPACPDLVDVPAGRFIMGDPGGANPTEVPATEVRITAPFAMSRTEITFDQWQSCVADGACRGGQDDHGWGKGGHPIINITWEDAQTYARWLSGRLGRACRLPTEAEWEYAAKAGAKTAFWWGDQPGTGKANCRDCQTEPTYGSKPVGSYPANPFGLADMNGNVWEWTQDCWTPSLAGRPADARAVGGDTPLAACPQRVMKGGSWYYFSPMARASNRAKSDGRGTSYNIGLRVVCEAMGTSP